MILDILRDRDNTKVFLVKSRKDPTVLLAISPTLIEVEEEKYIGWFDTVRPRQFEISEIKEIENQFIKVKAKNGNTYTLTPITPELFNDEVSPHLIGQPKFDSVEEIERFFQEAWMTGQIGP